MVKANEYINEIDLMKEIIISKGKGKLTDKALTMLLLIPVNQIKIIPYYRDRPEQKEFVISYVNCYILEKWNRFNEKKYDKAFPYFSEIVKRAIIAGFDQLKGVNSKTKDKHPRLILFSEYVPIHMGTNWNFDD